MRAPANPQHLPGATTDAATQQDVRINLRVDFARPTACKRISVSDAKLERS